MELMVGKELNIILLILSILDKSLSWYFYK